jgi:hypothetical protein
MSFNEKMARSFYEKAQAATDQATADWFMKQAVRYADKLGTTIEALTAPATEKKARCPHYKTIQAFAKAAREAGLSMADKDRARGAMGVYLGKRIESRSELTAYQWEAAITGVKAGVLFW